MMTVILDTTLTQTMKGENQEVEDHAMGEVFSQLAADNQGANKK